MPALRGGLLWDDTSHITRADLQSLHGLWRIWFQLGATQQYYPLVHTAFWTEHRLWGGAVLGYHLTNVLLHALSACLVVLIVRRLSIPGAWLSGLLFALHPISAESVAWIAGAEEYFAALLVVFWWQRGRIEGKRDIAPLVPWLAVGACAGLFTAWVGRTYTAIREPSSASRSSNRTIGKRT